MTHGRVETEQGALAISSRMLATGFSLCCFAAVLFIGALAQRNLASLMMMAIGVLIVSHLVGLIVGRLLETTLVEGIRNYEQQIPAPTFEPEAVEVTEESDEPQAEAAADTPATQAWESSKRKAA